MLDTARAISALEKILKRIRVTVAKMLRLSKEQNPVLDYNSLMSLSNTSRIEAIKTIDNLSRRLGSNNTSRASMSYTSSSKPPPPTPRHRDKDQSIHPHGSTTSSTTAPKQRNKSPIMSSSPKKKRSAKANDETSSKVKPEAATKFRDASTSRSKGEGVSSQTKGDGPKVKRADSLPTLKEEKPLPSRPKPTVEFEAPPSPPPKMEIFPQRRPIGIAQRIAAAADNRISFASFTSDSTKLGEIPERKSRSRYYTPASPGADQYNVPPLYPLRPYKVEAKEKGFWGGLFGRKKED